jgi:hypothetical protein
MEVAYLWPPWMTGSYHPRCADCGEAAGAVNFAGRKPNTASLVSTRATLLTQGVLGGPTGPLGTVEDPLDPLQIGEVPWETRPH